MTKRTGYIEDLSFDKGPGLTEEEKQDAENQYLADVVKHVVKQRLQRARNYMVRIEKLKSRIGQ